MNSGGKKEETIFARAVIPGTRIMKELKHSRRGMLRQSRRVGNLNYSFIT